MKKLHYLTMILVAMVVATSCEKDEDPINEPIVNPIITKTQLVGFWDFDRVTYNGRTYLNNPTDIQAFPLNYGYGGTENWEMFDNNNMRAYFLKTSSTSNDAFSFVLKLNTNEIDIIDRVMPTDLIVRYKIISYDSQGKYLTLEKTKNNAGGFIGGILVLKKR